MLINLSRQHRGAFEVRRSSLTGSGRPRRTAAQKVMLLLIESGFVYLIMGVSLLTPQRSLSFMLIGTLQAASGFTYFLAAQDLSSPGYFVTTVFISLRYQIVVSSRATPSGLAIRTAPSTITFTDQF